MRLLFTIVLAQAAVLNVPSVYLSISRALSAAQDGDTIQIAAVFLRGKENCDLIFKGSAANHLQLLGVGPEKTIIDCENKKRCLTADEGALLKISGLSFRGGSAPNTPSEAIRRSYVKSRSTGKDKRQEAEESVGGCINILNGSKVKIEDSVITGGRATKGGGIACVDSSIELRRTQLRNNGLQMALAGVDLYGAGMYVSNSSNVFLEYVGFFDNTLSNTEAGSVYGAGVAIEKSSNVTFGASCIFSRNSILTMGLAFVFGGGLYLDSCQEVWFGNSTEFSSNNVTTIGGSNYNIGGTAFFVQKSQNLTFSGDLLLSNNVMGARGREWIFGGVLYAVDVIALRFLGSVLSRNNVLLSQGGALYGQITFINMIDLVLTSVSITNCYVENMGDGSSFIDGGMLHLEFCTNTRFGSMFASENRVRGQGTIKGVVGYFLRSPDIHFGPLSLTNNSLTVANFGSGFGTMFFEECSGLDISNSFVAYNTLLSNSYDELGGIGIRLENTDAKMENLLLRDNTVVVDFLEIEDTGTYVAAESNRTVHCGQFEAPMTQSSGDLTEGAIDLYSNNLFCTWVVSSTSLTNRIFGKLQLSIVFLDINRDNSDSCIGDNLSFYDGPSASSALIGRYCGTLAEPICVGTCPDLQNITPTGDQITIVFVSNWENPALGFKIHWETVRLPNAISGEEGKMLNPIDIKSFAGGGAMSVLGGSVDVAHSVFENNSVKHPVLALGGAILFNTKASSKIQNCTFISNRAQGNIVGGGAISTCSQGGSGTVLISSSIFTRNEAHASGTCINSFLDGTIRCAASFGASLVSVGATLNVVNSDFFQNIATCDQHVSNRSAHGGAIAATRDSTVTLQGIGCSMNRVICPQGCSFGDGGCIYTTSVMSITNSKVFNNTVWGVGGGGGISVMATSRSKIARSTFLFNTASEGGGGVFMGTSQTLIDGCAFNQNAAVFSGGIVMLDDAIVDLRDSFFDRNVGTGRTSTIMALNTNKKARFTIQNTTVALVGPSLGLSENAANMIGVVEIDTSTVVWKCLRPGTVFQQEYSRGSHYTLSCVTCGIGTYSAVNAASSQQIEACRACPLGATCKGATEESNGLIALRGFWGSQDSEGSVKMIQCPSGYCCNSEGCSFDFCSGGREGRLCGKCPEGYGRVFFSETCRLKEKCGDASWAFPAVVACAFLYSLFLLVTSGTKPSGLLSVLLFFYQVISLVKTSPWKTQVAALIEVLGSISNMTPSYGDSSLVGVCIIPEMSAHSKMAARVGFHAIVAVSFGALYLLQYLLQLARLRSVKPPDTAIYAAAFIRFLCTAFTSLLLIPLQILQCVYIEMDHVWFWDATLTCFQTWQFLWLFPLLLLIPLPMILMIFMWKGKKHRENKSKTETAIRTVLQNAFTHEARFWLGVSLYRRFFLVLCFTVIVDLNWRSMVTSLLCIVFLLVNVMWEPFENKFAQTFESLSLSILCLLSVSSSVQTSQIQFGSLMSVANEQSLEMVQFVLAVFPIVLYAIGIIHSKCIGRHKRTRETTTVLSETPIDDEQSQLFEQGWEWQIC